MTLSTGAAGTGKGTNVMAIFHAALDLDAERVVVFDADVRSIEPDWLARMLDAVGGVSPAVAVPVYRRNRYEGNTTNHIVSPLLAATLGVHVQQPIAGTSHSTALSWNGRWPGRCRSRPSSTASTSI